MSFDDGRKILAGGDTAATEYFKAKTTDKLVVAFRPVVGQAMNEVGVTGNTRIWSDAIRLSHLSRPRRLISTITS